MRLSQRETGGKIKWDFIVIEDAANDWNIFFQWIKGNGYLIESNSAFFF